MNSVLRLTLFISLLAIIVGGEVTNKMAHSSERCQVSLTSPTPLAMEAACLSTKLDKTVPLRKVVVGKVDPRAVAEMVVLQQPYHGFKDKNGK